MKNQNAITCLLTTQGKSIKNENGKFLSDKEIKTLIKNSEFVDIGKLVERYIISLPGNDQLNKRPVENGPDNTDFSETKFRTAKLSPNSQNSYVVAINGKTKKGTPSNINKAKAVRFITYVPTVDSLFAFIIPAKSIELGKPITISFNKDGICKSKKYAKYEVPLRKINKPI
jgi:hypothetical protein